MPEVARPERVLRGALLVAAVAALGACGERAAPPTQRPASDTPSAPQHAVAARPRTAAPPRAGGATARSASALHVLAAPLPARAALEPLGEPLRVEVLDPRGRPAAGVEVAWTVLRGGGTVQPTSSRTDGAGVAASSWTPGPSADPQVVAVSVAGIGAAELRTSVAVASVTIRPDPLSLWPGDSVALRAELADAAGHSLAGGRVHWSAADPATARVTADGVVVGVRAGATRVVADAGPAKDTLSVSVVAAVAGRLYTLDGAPPPAARIVVRANGRTDSLTAGASGAFSLRLLRTPWDSVDVSVVPADPRFFPARLRLGEPRELGDLGILLLPRTWTTTGATFGGRTFAVSPSAAIARTADGARFWRLERGEPRSTWLPAGWRAALLPVRVSFSATQGERVTPADSAAFWRIARALERDLDARLFEPAADPGEEGQGTIHVVVDRTSRDPGYTVASWNATGMIGEATMIFRAPSLLADPAVATHELMHAIGVGHTSSWSSIMNPGGQGTAGLSPNDVAYAQLLLHIVRAQEANGAYYGVVEAAAGERGGDAPPALPDTRDRTRTP